MNLKTLFVRRSDAASVQFVRSILVSNVSFLLDFCICLLLVSLLKLNYILATMISFTTGSVLNYILSLLWVFKGSSKKRHVEFLSFLAVSFIGLGLNALGMFLFTGLLGIYYLASRIMAASLVFLFNFAGKKFLVFGWLSEKLEGMTERGKHGETEPGLAHSQPRD